MEADCRLEALALPCLGYLAIQLVNSLKRETLCLVDHRPHEEGANDTERSPDEEDFGVEVRWFVDHVRCNNGDDGVEEPVGCGGDGKTLGAGFEREDFASDDPGTRTPCRCEEGAA